MNDLNTLLNPMTTEEEKKFLEESCEEKDIQGSFTEKNFTTNKPNRNVKRKINIENSMGMQ